MPSSGFGVGSKSMMPDNLYAVVRFQDKAKTLFVVSSKDIRGFDAVHSLDFDENETYSVLWQEGTDSFDGYFAAKIICMSASLEELKVVAAAKGIKRLPPSYLALVKRQRNSTPSPIKRTADQTDPGSSPSRKQLKADVVQSKKRRMASLLHAITDKKATPSSAEATPSSADKIKSAPVPVDLDETLPIDYEIKRDEEKNDNLVLDKEDDESENEESDDDEENDDDDSYSSSDGSEDSSDSDEDLNAAALKKLTEEQKNEIMQLQSCCKVSEESRRKCLSENKSLLEKVKSLENEKLEAKLEILKLSKQTNISAEDFKKLEGENKKLAEENKRLKTLLNSAKDLLNSGLPSKHVKKNLFSDKSSTPKEEASRSSVEDIKLFEINDDFADLIEDTEHSNAGSLTYTECPDLNFSGEASPSLNKKKMKELRESGLTPAEMIAISEKVKNDITGAMPMPVNSKGKIEIGGGLLVSKEKWDKAIKVQAKNTLFIKKLSTHVYGPNDLKIRTVGIPRVQDKGKQPATPKKVDAFVACLRGKLLSTDPNFPNVDKAAEAARTILARKMQDEARERKQKKDTQNERRKEAHKLVKKSKKTKKSKKKSSS